MDAAEDSEQKTIFFNSPVTSINIDPLFTPLLYISSHGLFTSKNDELDTQISEIDMKTIYAVKIGSVNYLPQEIIESVIEKIDSLTRSSGNNYNFVEIQQMMNEIMIPRKVRRFLENRNSLRKIDNESAKDHEIYSCSDNTNLMYHTKPGMKYFDKTYSLNLEEIQNTNMHPHDNKIGLIYRDRKDKLHHIDITAMLFERIRSNTKSSTSHITMKTIHDFCRDVIGVNMINIIDFSCGSTDMSRRTTSLKQRSIRRGNNGFNILPPGNKRKRVGGKKSKKRHKTKKNTKTKKKKNNKTKRR